MRFRRLEFTAFGPFTSEVLDLSAGAPGGLHVVFGPNEAGKSTSLRAVRALLFGIPARSGDAHLHSLPRLELRAELEHDGRTLEVRRVKRRKDTLLNAEGEPLAESTLVEMLGHLDDKTFSTRLGLDQVELERGAEALLGGSEQGLFAAGTAGSEVRRVLGELERECEFLFLPKGRVPKLNHALARHHEDVRRAAEAVRPPEKWLEQKRAEEEARQRVDELRKKRADIRAEHGHKSRLGSLLSDLSRLVEVKRRLEALGAVVELEESSTAARLDAERRLRDAEIELTHGDLGLAELERRFAEIGDPGSLATVEEVSVDLKKRLGWEYKAREDRPKLEGRLRAGEERLVELAAGLGIRLSTEDIVEAVSRIVPQAVDERRLRQIVSREGAIRTEMLEAERQLVEVRSEWAARARSNEARTPLDLRQATEMLARGQEAQGSLTRLDEWRELLGRATQKRSRLERELGFAGSASERPLGFDLERAERADRELERWSVEQQENERRKRALEAEIRALDLRRDRIRGGEDLPSEASLAQARRERDDFVPTALDASIPNRVEELRGRIARADDVADRLRREGARLIELEEVERERERLELRLVEVAAELEKIEEARSRLVDEWTARWRSFGIDWGARSLTALVKKANEWVALDEEMDVVGRRVVEAETRVIRVARELAEFLGEAREIGVGDFAGLLSETSRRFHEAQREAERERSARERFEELERQLLPAETRATSARARLEEWQASYVDALGRVGLPLDLDSEAIEDSLAIFTELSKVLDDAREKQRRLRGIDRDSEVLKQDVERVVRRHGEDVSSRDLLDTVSELLTRIDAARAKRVERERLAGEIRDQRERWAEVKVRASAAELELDALCRSAGVRSLVELPTAEARSREARELGRERRELAALLSEKSGGQPLDALLREAAEIEHGRLFAEIDELSSELEELEERVRDAESEWARLRQGLGFYSSEDAALLRQTAVTRGAEVRTLLRRYLVQKSAEMLLSREMSRYAERYAGPLARRAGELFERLTLGRYQGLRVGIGEKTIRSVRDGREVEVSELSRGTRAQLYFALRVASLETYFHEHPPVPLLLDDLFVDFDDDRATSAFEILGDLSKQVQILYFTHLGRDVELSHNALSAGRVFEHRLSTG